MKSLPLHILARPTRRDVSSHSDGLRHNITDPELKLWDVDMTLLKQDVHKLPFYTQSRLLLLHVKALQARVV